MAYNHKRTSYRCSTRKVNFQHHSTNKAAIIKPAFRVELADLTGTWDVTCPIGPGNPVYSAPIRSHRHLRLFALEVRIVTGVYDAAFAADALERDRQIAWDSAAPEQHGWVGWVGGRARGAIPYIRVDRSTPATATACFWYLGLYTVCVFTWKDRGLLPTYIHELPNFILTIWIYC